jgi:hypothetical protein
MPGLASHLDVARRPRCVVAQAASLCPSLPNPRESWTSGTGSAESGRIYCYCSVELDGAARPAPLGQGLALRRPDDPGRPRAVITNSTRPDNLNAALAARRRAGPVAIFDRKGTHPAYRRRLVGLRSGDVRPRSPPWLVPGPSRPVGRPTPASGPGNSARVVGWRSSKSATRPSLREWSEAATPGRSCAVPVQRLARR